ncbi:hypothetical protein [Pandoraea sp. ISTKB]|uniref:hypothetical protein n=1 Tax=Pandoraea sp. ISTKB TaxID=1586708 RepID=UPI001112FFAC|nr:hypothetical protein [Pandoraea sp. ISTKB]
MTQSIASTPEYAQFLGAYSPWLASHAVDVGYAATALVWSATVVLPWILVHGDQDGRLQDAQDTMIDWGLAVLTPVATVAWIISVGYLLGLGFFGAKNLF